MEKDSSMICQSKNNDAASFCCYVGWEEVWVCGEKGRREVHYYLKKKDGSKDLAVVGKEKSLRHMTYCNYFNNNYSNLNHRNISMATNVKDPVLSKLKSRREVILWLNSVVPDIQSHQTLKPTEAYFESKDAQQPDADNLKNVRMTKIGWNMSEFTWLGSSWICRKKRRHYQSYQRIGVQIYVHDFVYVLAEEDKRLVAYLEDMYEDSRGNKMVVVRWFHKIDEVGIVLPHNYNDREIFFSLCLQDLSIECIDGVATVLSPEHYEKFLREARHTRVEPFVCHMQFENDDVKPFDITQVKGYWKQDILRYMSVSSASMDLPSDDGLKMEGNDVDAIVSRPLKRLRRSKDCDDDLQCNRIKSVDANLRDCSDNLDGCEGNAEIVAPKGGCLIPFHVKDAAVPKHMQCLTIGSHVEVLSQDSGVRGCWFRALIVKKYKDKVKVQYQDIKDAAEETKNLEEWILASRVAAVDDCGIRISGRTIVRPTPTCNKGGVSCGVNIGSIVDAWWHDGWWEGIVVKKESEDKLHVYFPGEKQVVAFARADLRYSLEWLKKNGWNYMEERVDLVPTLSRPAQKVAAVESLDVKPDQISICDEEQDVSGGPLSEILTQKDEAGCGSPGLLPVAESVVVVRDLSKDDLLAKLRWKSSGKRRVGRSPTRKVHYDVKKTGAVDTRKQTSERFLIRPSMKVDPDYCKFASDSLYSSAAASPITSLVMSR